MAVNTIYAPSKQPGNGTQVAFTFAFKILLAADIVAKKYDAAGNITVGVLGVDYTVSFDAQAENGTVTWTVAPVNGGFSWLGRDSDETQGTRYPRDNSLPAKTTETALDKLTMLWQEMQIQTQVVGWSSGTDVAMQALAVANPSTIFTAVMLTSRTIQVYLGDTALGVNGWATLGGF